MRTQSHKMGPQWHQIMPEIYRKELPTHKAPIVGPHRLPLHCGIIAYLHKWRKSRAWKKKRKHFWSARFIFVFFFFFLSFFLMIFIFMIIVMIMSFTFLRSHCNIIERKIVSGKWKTFGSVCFYCWFASTTTSIEYKLLLCLIVLVLGDLANACLQLLFVMSTFRWKRFRSAIFIDGSFRSIVRYAYQIQRFHLTLLAEVPIEMSRHFGIQNLFCVDAHLTAKTDGSI